VSRASMSKPRRVLLFLAIAAAGFTATVALVVRWWRPIGGRIEGDRAARVRSSPNWRDGSFRNQIPTTLGDMWGSLVRQVTGKQVRVPPAPVPIQRLSAMDLGVTAAAGLRAVWIGHSTVIVDIDGVRVVTDPIWSERCSPFESIGPQRFHPPPIDLGAIGRVDAVVISHDHYDHLDMKSVQALAARGAAFFVPLGIGAHLERWDVPLAQIRELDWGESAQLRGLRIVSLPARHYSGRAIARDKTQWASWALVGPTHRVWFSGDTGFFPGMRDIGSSYGPFDLALIKIGAYGETWPQIHIDPEEAVETHLAVKAKLMLPVHWGTFNLAFHDWFEPPERLMKAGAGRIAFVIPRAGEIVDVGRPASVETWWRF
jgi:L-ascorbate metabolism protein UlaG (beta-lactamase superfamily)